MTPLRNVRDSELIDALEHADTECIEGIAWRIVREGKDPCLCGRAGGRWDDRTFDVLYTSLEREGAIAEMYFHLSRGLPIIPSKMRYRLFELRISLPRVVRLSTLANLSALGLDASAYGKLSYDERESEYSRTQDIAETAHFLEYKGMLVPNARWQCSNLIIFCELAPMGSYEVFKDAGVVDWGEWRPQASPSA